MLRLNVLAKLHDNGCTYIHKSSSRSSLWNPIEYLQKCIPTQTKIHAEYVYNVVTFNVNWSTFNGLKNMATRGFVKLDAVLTYEYSKTLVYINLVRLLTYET